MKILFLLTGTPNCEPFWRSLEFLGHDVRIERYDDRPHDRHHELIDLAGLTKPNAIVYVGAYAPSHGLPVPEIDILKRLRDIAPSILLCGDAADHPWWPVLESYHNAECFNVIVAMDGGTSPVDGFHEGLTLLTPLDPRPFIPRPWAARNVRFGMVGGLGHRSGTIEQLVNRGVLEYQQGPAGRTYAQMAEIMCRTKLTLCCGRTGTGQHLHVKGRMIEAGFAGSAVFELRGSPASRWFSRGIDYLEYEMVEDVIETLNSVSGNYLENVAMRFHDKVTWEHSPHKFWTKVFNKAGI